MKVLVILNDPPYGSERSYNGLRLARSLALTNGTEVRIFLLGDAVGCGVANQNVPEGYYHLDRMLGSAARHSADIGCCGTCMDARAIEEERLVKGAHRSSMDELTEWVGWADKVVNF